ncbi:hypothetical protein DERF_004615 [Dermatophagoides farinae]|uniref:Uncharacterized protein n=1 Tax=Dermatophagoides farinae TaxID=6954 RepID=A0A922I3N0_DERFA|nr:hypothetical protein DERF_004615 [Dermatophagoides farinae]
MIDCGNERVVVAVEFRIRYDDDLFITTNNEKLKPPNNTTNTPPTLSIFNGVTEPELFFGSSIHWPPPFFCFHHRSFNVNNAPLSCSFNIACDNGVRYGKKQHCSPFRVATPYPLESKRPPICVRLQFLSIIYSIDADSIR